LNQLLFKTLPLYLLYYTLGRNPTVINKIFLIKPVEIIHSNSGNSSGIRGTEVKLSLCLITHHTMKAHGWVEV
jgi:hypothetical protein